MVTPFCFFFFFVSFVFPGQQCPNWKFWLLKSSHQKIQHSPGVKTPPTASLFTQLSNSLEILWVFFFFLFKKSVCFVQTGQQYSLSWNTSHVFWLKRCLVHCLHERGESHTESSCYFCSCSCAAPRSAQHGPLPHCLVAFPKDVAFSLVWGEFSSLIFIVFLLSFCRRKNKCRRRNRPVKLKRDRISVLFWTVILKFLFKINSTV